MTYLPDDPDDWQWLTEKNLEVIPSKDVVDLVPVAGDESFAESAPLVVCDVSIFH